jgi:hypothetical protein
MYILILIVIIFCLNDSDIQTNDYIPAWQTNPQIINQDVSFSLRRPRADTMPNQSTSFPYTDRFDTLSPDTAPSTDSDTPYLSLRSRSGSTTNQLFGGGIFNHWIGETLQSPTSPTTTDQLLKEDDGNTIASTLASLGLDGIQERRNLLHASHSYSSLSEASSQSDWHRDMTYGSDSSFIRGSSIATMRLQAQTGRPRALSAVDDRTEDSNPSFHHRSAWLSDSVSYQKSTATHRPFLRSSNSSADLLETIARQRKAATTLDESNSRTGVN